MAGCGDDGDNGSGAPSTSSNPAFVARANNVCTRLQEEYQQAYVKAFGAKQPTPAQQVQFTISTGIPNIERQLSDLKKLRAPEADRATLENYFATYEKAIAQLKRDPSVVNQSALPQLFKAANRLALDYGIDRCVR